MEALSPRSTNLPMMPRPATIKVKMDPPTKPDDKEKNQDKIEDKWRPASVVKEPGPVSESYVTGKKLGKGGFAVCFEGRLERTGQLFAMKVVKSQVQQKKQLEKFRTELQIHAKMHHPNIVEFFRAFSFEDYTYVILELCPNGSLMEMVKSRGCLSLPEVRRYMIQICGGVKYMHRRSVIHRDLKMGNIFLDSHMNLKIGDFGLAAVVVDEKDRRTTLCGTPNYIAPEILLNKSQGQGHDNKVDTWAVGIICYALLIGTPPFASKTQTEIYAKLKQLQYEWKTDSKNFIPPQAKDLVTSCLNLNSADRPEMDDLVEHPFFQMGAIAEELDRACRTATPTWLENVDPRGDKVRHGYGVEYEKICQSCGVGKNSSGRPRTAVGENACKSAVAEIVLENEQHCAPVVPLPAGLIYKAFSEAKEDWTTAKVSVQAPRVRSRKPVTAGSASLDMTSVARALPDSVPNTNALTKPASIVPISVGMRSVPSFAAQQRQQALHPRSLTQRANPTKEVRPAYGLESGEAVHSEPRAYLRDRPLRSTTGRSTRSNSSRDAAVEVHSRSTASSTTSGTRGTVESIPSALRSRSVFFQEAKPGRTGRYASRNLQSDRSTSPSPSVSSDNTVPTSSASTLIDQKQSSLDAASTDTHQASATSSQPQELVETTSTPLNVHPKPRLISSSDLATTVKQSGPQAVLESLHTLHEDLSRTRSYRRSRKEPSSDHMQPHTVVEKWVDYTNKYGIAYILSNNTVGLVLKSIPLKLKASSCVVVRQSKNFYTRRSQRLETQLVPQRPDTDPIAFFEDSAEGLRRVDVPATKFKLDTESYSDSNEAVTKLGESMAVSADVEKVRLVVLADKFGKYMTKALGEGEDDFERGPEEAAEEADVNAPGLDTFIKFYQRLGNVGIWGYGDGAFQFNFPDHTKMVLYRLDDSPARLLLDLYHLQPADATFLAKHGVFKEKALERRNLVTLVMEDVLAGTGSAGLKKQALSEIVKSNEVKEKLAWVKGVVGCWIREGGLGKMGDEKLGWAGLQEKNPGDERKAKLVWVTVGRAGGDADAEEEAAAAGIKKE